MTSQAWSEIVEAYGGDKAQAEAEANERLEALRALKPEVSREEVVERLAWEVRPRTIEHVFPGDNWYFMVKAAQSGANILLLDIEDAVATTRKEIARPVIALLIKALRGVALKSEEVEFLTKNALPEGRAEQLAEAFEPADGGFTLKAENRFPPDQMILVRPNNLRTSWSAGDYVQVVREVGDLIDGIYLPKIEEADDVLVAVRILRAIQAEMGWRPGRHKVFVLTELPGAILQAREILAVAPEVDEINLGVVDYTAATGGRSIVQQEQYTYMRFPLLTIVEAARSTGKVAGTGITVMLNADDTEQDTLKAIALGVNRKWSVHPAHVEGIARHAGSFPPPVRKRIDYEPIEPFDLDKLKQLAADNKPILPPTVFIPRPVILARSVVEARAEDQEALRAALDSAADMVICDVQGLFGPDRQAARRALGEALASPGGEGKVIALQADLSGPDAPEALAGLLSESGDAVGGFIIPAVEDAQAVRAAAGLLTEAEREVGLAVGTLALGARLLEPGSVEREAHEIAEASRRMNWLVLDLNGALPKEALDDPETKGYHYYHSALVAATAHADIDAVSGPSEPSQVEAEALFAANLGFHGKLVVPEDSEKVAHIMNPPRAGEPPEDLASAEGKAFHSRWTNSVERALEILELYATADQERQLGAVAYNDPISKQPELVDAATARIYYRQLERALKADHLTEEEAERYVTARQRLLLALRPGGTEQLGTAVFPGQTLLGYATTVREWMVQAFAKTSGDRNRYHLDIAYAEASRFGQLVAHGLLTTSVMLASLGRLLPGDTEESLSVRFRAPVAFGDTITPLAHVEEVFEDGRARLSLKAMNQAGVVVSEGEVTIKPQARPEPVVPAPKEIPWARKWAGDVTASVPEVVYDFTDPETPRVQTLTKDVTEEVARATRALFGALDPHQLSALLALGAMAMASAESSPGHLLLSVDVEALSTPTAGGDKLTLTVTAPETKDIRRSKKGKGPPIVPLSIEITNEKGEEVLRGRVVKLMEEL
jgi:3-hydroxybutyryl-CoA dehydratase